MNEYEGHWISTYTGKKVHYLNPLKEEICIEDIAHALALTCRFGGHCNVFYSVAEHSIRVANEVDRDHKLAALLHDAHEAYLHDVPRPIKEDIVRYKEIADVIQTAINKKFGLSFGYDVSHADDVLLATEARDLLSNTHDWDKLPSPLPIFIIPIEAPSIVEKMFLDMFEIYSKDLLTKEDNNGYK